jgi:hypothetical protein
MHTASARPFRRFASATPACHLRTVREAQGGSEFGKQTDAVSDIVLLVFREGLPPGSELFGKLDFPGHTLLCHRQNIPCVISSYRLAASEAYLGDKIEGSV